MASAKLVKMDGSDAGTIELNDAVFGVPLKPTLLHDVAVALQSARRQGNAETKTRDMVSGGGIKPFRQKGTGNARQGSSREVQMRGGGVAFGPHKRSYRQSVPRSFKRQALCSALSERLRDDALRVLEGFTMESPKTKVFAEMVANVVPGARKVLVVTAAVDSAVLLSSRNLPGARVCTAADLNAVDVLDATEVVIAREAVGKLEERLVKKTAKEVS
jgi:large subunit ribosomal protein L4